MKWLLAGIGVLVAVLMVAIAVAWLVGRSMPAEHEAAMSQEIAASLERVAARVRDVQAQPTWRPGVKGIDVMQRTDSVLRYVERGPNGTIPFAFREVEHDRTFTSTIDSDTLEFGGTWTIELAPISATVTRVTITERGVVRSPVFRAMARYVFGHTRTIAAYLGALGEGL